MPTSNLGNTRQQQQHTAVNNPHGAVEEFPEAPSSQPPGAVPHPSDDHEGVVFSSGTAYHINMNSSNNNSSTNNSNNTGPTPDLDEIRNHLANSGPYQQMILQNQMSVDSDNDDDHPDGGRGHHRRHYHHDQRDNDATLHNNTIGHHYNGHHQNDTTAPGQSASNQNSSVISVFEAVTFGVAEKFHEHIVRPTFYIADTSHERYLKSITASLAFLGVITVALVLVSIGIELRGNAAEYVAVVLSTVNVAVVLLPLYVYMRCSCKMPSRNVIDFIILLQFAYVFVLKACSSCVSARMAVLTLLFIKCQFRSDTISFVVAVLMSLALCGYSLAIDYKMESYNYDMVANPLAMTVGGIAIENYAAYLGFHGFVLRSGTCALLQHIAALLGALFALATCRGYALRARNKNNPDEATTDSGTSSGEREEEDSAEMVRMMMLNGVLAPGGHDNAVLRGLRGDYVTTATRQQRSQLVTVVPDDGVRSSGSNHRRRQLSSNHNNDNDNNRIPPSSADERPGSRASSSDMNDEAAIHRAYQQHVRQQRGGGAAGSEGTTSPVAANNSNNSSSMAAVAQQQFVEDGIQHHRHQHHHQRRSRPRADSGAALSFGVPSIDASSTGDRMSLDSPTSHATTSVLSSGHDGSGGAGGGALVGRMRSQQHSNQHNGLGRRAADTIIKLISVLWNDEDAEQDYYLSAELQRQQRGGGGGGAVANSPLSASARSASTSLSRRGVTIRERDLRRIRDLAPTLEKLAALVRSAAGQAVGTSLLVPVQTSTSNNLFALDVANAGGVGGGSGTDMSSGFDAFAQFDPTSGRGSVGGGGGGGGPMLDGLHLFDMGGAGGGGGGLVMSNSGVASNPSRSATSVNLTHHGSAAADPRMRLDGGLFGPNSVSEHEVQRAGPMDGFVLDAPGSMNNANTNRYDDNFSGGTTTSESIGAMSNYQTPVNNNHDPRRPSGEATSTTPTMTPGTEIPMMVSHVRQVGGGGGSGGGGGVVRGGGGAGAGRVVTTATTASPAPPQQQQQQQQYQSSNRNNNIVPRLSGVFRTDSLAVDETAAGEHPLGRSGESWTCDADADSPNDDVECLSFVTLHDDDHRGTSAIPWLEDLMQIAQLAPTGVVAASAPRASAGAGGGQQQQSPTAAVGSPNSNKSGLRYATSNVGALMAAIQPRIVQMAVVVITYPCGPVVVCGARTCSSPVVNNKNKSPTTEDEAKAATARARHQHQQQLKREQEMKHRAVARHHQDLQLLFTFINDAVMSTQGMVLRHCFDGQCVIAWVTENSTGEAPTIAGGFVAALQRRMDRVPINRRAAHSVAAFAGPAVVYSCSSSSSSSSGGGGGGASSSIAAANSNNYNNVVGGTGTTTAAAPQQQQMRFFSSPPSLQASQQQAASKNNSSCPFPSLPHFDPGSLGASDVSFPNVAASSLNPSEGNPCSSGGNAPLPANSNNNQDSNKMGQQQQQHARTNSVSPVVSRIQRRWSSFTNVGGAASAQFGAPSTPAASSDYNNNRVDMSLQVALSCDLSQKIETVLAMIPSGATDGLYLLDVIVKQAFPVRTSIVLPFSVRRTAGGGGGGGGGSGGAVPASPSSPPTAAAAAAAAAASAGGGGPWNNSNNMCFYTLVTSLEEPGAATGSPSLGSTGGMDAAASGSSCAPFVRMIDGLASELVRQGQLQQQHQHQYHSAVSPTAVQERLAPYIHRLVALTRSVLLARRGPMTSSPSSAGGGGGGAGSDSTPTWMTCDRTLLESLPSFSEPKFDPRELCKRCPCRRTSTLPGCGALQRVLALTRHFTTSATQQMMVSVSVQQQQQQLVLQQLQQQQQPSSAAGLVYKATSSVGKASR